MRPVSLSALLSMQRRERRRLRHRIVTHKLADHRQTDPLLQKVGCGAVAGSALHTQLTGRILQLADPLP